MDIVKGRTYRVKKPANSGGLVNDRQVVYVSATSVQYDGPTVGFGRHYPTVSREKFEAWAGEDVTDSLPKGEWLGWDARPRVARASTATPSAAVSATAPCAAMA